MPRPLPLLALAALLCAAQPPAPEGYLRNGVTAHRGDSGDHPENTLQAFASAIDIGADWIELDVHLTKDRQLVVTHDPDTARVTGKSLRVAEATYEELAALDVATRHRAARRLTLAQCPPARMPLLADALRLVMRQARTRVSIQPKDECVQDAFALIRALRAEPWVGFNDGSLNTLRQVKTLSRAVPVFWDRPADSVIADDLRVALEEGFECLMIHRDGLTRAKVDAIHRAGLQAGAWTVNEEDQMRALLALGADRLYTDRPARLLRARGK